MMVYGFRQREEFTHCSLAYHRMGAEGLCLGEGHHPWLDNDLGTLTLTFVTDNRSSQIKVFL